MYYLITVFSLLLDTMHLYIHMNKHFLLKESHYIFLFINVSFMLCIFNSVKQYNPKLSQQFPDLVNERLSDYKPLHFM